MDSNHNLRKNKKNTNDLVSYDSSKRLKLSESNSSLDSYELDMQWGYPDFVGANEEIPPDYSPTSDDDISQAYDDHLSHFSQANFDLSVGAYEDVISNDIANDNAVDSFVNPPPSSSPSSQTPLKQENKLNFKLELPQTTSLIPQPQLMPIQSYKVSEVGTDINNDVHVEARKIILTPDNITLTKKQLENLDFDGQSKRRKKHRTHPYDISSKIDRHVVSDSDDESIVITTRSYVAENSDIESNNNVPTKQTIKRKKTDDSGDDDGVVSKRKNHHMDNVKIKNKRKHGKDYDEIIPYKHTRTVDEDYYSGDNNIKTPNYKKNDYREEGLLKIPKQRETPTVTTQKIYNTKCYAIEVYDTKIFNTQHNIDHIYKYYPKAHMHSKEQLYQSLLALQREIAKYKIDFDDTTRNSKPIIYLSSAKINEVKSASFAGIGSSDDEIRRYLKTLSFEDFLIILGGLKTEYDMYSSPDNDNLKSLTNKLRKQFKTDLTSTKPTFLNSLNSELNVEQFQTLTMEWSYSVVLLMFTALEIITKETKNITNKNHLSLEIASEYFKIFKNAVN